MGNDRCSGQHPRKQHSARQGGKPDQGTVSAGDQDPSPCLRQQPGRKCSHHQSLLSPIPPGQRSLPHAHSSNKLPVVLKDFQGRPVFTDRLGSDAVMFLVGRGLTDWLPRMLSTACSPLHTPSHPSPELLLPTGPSWPG